MSRMLLLFCLCLSAQIGCGASRGEQPTVKQPRPVTVFTLQSTDPQAYDRLTGSVTSWKTEDIGFEVDGRVQFVIEPETDVVGRERQQNGTPSATLLASLDEERYQLRVKSAGAQVLTAERQRDATGIEIESVIPAQLRAAQAEVTRAGNEFERVSQLFKKDVSTKEELDRARASLDTAQAEVARTIASTEVKRAEFASIEAQIDQLQNALSESNRDLKDCQLFSSFSGQVAAVHVVPGSYVNRGQAVVTVQMMDPIKIDFEVSAATARRLDYNDIIPVVVALREGDSLELTGSLYMIDPAADPDTRTFTATVLLRNQLTHAKVPADVANRPLARTKELARVIRNVPEFPRKDFVRVDAIQQDDDGAYVWKILNRNANTAVRDANPVLQVQKVRVTVGDTRVPFLQLWTFADVSFPDKDSINLEEDLLAGPVSLPDEAAGPWKGEMILYDRPRWLLKPGDLVSLDISGGQFPVGFYVPLDAIQESAGKYFMFTVQSSAEEGSRAQRVEVQLRERLDTLQRVEVVGQPSLAPGTKVIAEGAHFLVDGEAVTIASETEVRR